MPPSHPPKSPSDPIAGRAGVPRGWPSGSPGSEPFELAPQLGQHTVAGLARYAGAIGEDGEAIVGG